MTHKFILTVEVENILCMVKLKELFTIPAQGHDRWNLVKLSFRSRNTKKSFLIFYLFGLLPLVQHNGSIFTKVFLSFIFYKVNNI
jgi:hypothetical protein